MNDKNSEYCQGNGLLDHETYLNTRENYDKAELEVSGRYDKWILTLSGGALGLSITFIDKIAKSPAPDTFFWLKMAWACLIFSLLAGLLSLLTSQSAIRENRDELDNSYVEERSPQFKSPRWFTFFTNVLNWGSMFVFVIGVIFLCFFSFVNLNQEISKGAGENDRKIQKTGIQQISEDKDRRRIRSVNTTENNFQKKGIRTIHTPEKEEKITQKKE